MASNLINREAKRELKIRNAGKFPPFCYELNYSAQTWESTVMFCTRLETLWKQLTTSVEFLKALACYSWRMIQKPCAQLHSLWSTPQLSNDYQSGVVEHIPILSIA